MSWTHVQETKKEFLIYQMHANKQNPILSKEILSGSWFKDIKTGDTLCDENTQLFLSHEISCASNWYCNWA
jgi:hypothetical protein